MVGSPSSASVQRRVALIGSFDAVEHSRLLKLFCTYSGGGYRVTFAGMDRLRKHRGRAVRISTGLECRYILRGFGYANWRLLIGYPLWMLRAFLYALRLRADVAHVFELDSGLPMAAASLFRPIPFIYDAQDNYDLRKPWPFPLKHLIRWADGWVMKRASAIIVPDENRIVGPFARFRHKILVIPNCPPQIRPPARMKPRDPNVLTVLAMGYLGERRGINQLLDAVSLVPEARVLMAGQFYEPWLEAKARSMPQVEFRGWVPWEEAIALGYEADVVYAFYDPARKVNVLANSGKWFDAMMTGTPILSNREIANASWIQEIGYLCPYGNKEELARVLRAILNDREQAAQKGRRARALYEQKYNWALMEQRLLGAVRSIIGSPAPIDRARDLQQPVRVPSGEAVSRAKSGGGP